MSLRKKIMFLILAAVTIAELSPSPAVAQNFDGPSSIPVKAESPFEFAKKTEGYVALMELSKNQDEAVQNFLKEYIPCQNEICNRKTQKCIKATVQDNWASGSSQYASTNVKRVVCKCIGINEDPKKYNRWSFGTASTPRFAEAPDGCDGTVSQTIVSTAMDTFQYSTKKTCWDNSSDGRRYCMTFQGDEASIKYANESNNATRGCEVLPVKLYNYRKCFFCPLVGVIYDGSAKITDVAFSKMAAAFSTLLAVGFAIWVALQVLTQVSSLTKQDAPKFLGNLIKQSYKVIIAFILLQNSQQIFNYAIRPILETGLVFGQNMLTTQDIFDGLDRDKDGNYIRQAKAVTGGEHYELGTYDKLEQFVVAVQREIAFMQAVGTSLVCTGTNLMMLKGNITEFGDGFQMFIQGFILAFFGFLLSLAFVFYLIDGIVQIGVVGALLPFLIAAWPFKATSKYASTGTQMLLNSAFLFLFVGFVISANIFLVNEALNQTRDEQQSELLSLCGQPDYFAKNKVICEKALRETPRMGALFEIAQTLNSLDSSKLKQLTDISSVGFLILLFCCIFGFKFTNQAGSLADKFASGTISKPIAPGIATMGTSFAKSAALRATEDLREAAGDRAERLVKGTVGLIPRGVSAAWRKIRGKDKPHAAGNNVTPQKFEASKVQDDNEAAGSNARQGVTFNEKGKNAQATPTLNERTNQNKSTPTLGEANGRKVSPRKQNIQDAQQDAGANGEDISDFQAEEISSPEENNEGSSPKNGSSQPAKNAQRAYEARAPQQKSRHQSTSGRLQQPRRPAGKTQPEIHRQPRGGSGHNRANSTKRLRGKTNG